MAFIDELKDQLLYDYQNEFFCERGMSCKYRLVLAGTELFEKYLGEGADTAEIVEFFKKEGLAEDVEFTEDDFQTNEIISGCIFKPLCTKFMEKGRQPMCCPLTNALMRAFEKKTGNAPEMLPVSFEDGKCKVGLGKFGNADVVAAKGVF